VTRRHQHVFILFDLKRELFLHAGILPHKTASGKYATPRCHGAHSLPYFGVTKTNSSRRFFL
jgi:hypothetical protein